MMSSSQQKTGIPYEDLDTPSLLVDVDIFESNVAKMAAFLGQGTTRLRPHSKTHKCPIIAKRQMEAGAIGVCCQKLGEAEVMVDHGIEDVLITNQIVGPIKIARLMNVARHADVKVAVETSANVTALAEAAVAAGLELGVVIEVDVGMQRCGVTPGEGAAELARVIDRTPGVRLRGLMGYEGHCVMIRDFAQRKIETQKANGLLVNSAKAVEAAGIEVGIVSAGGTGTHMIAGRYPGITEVEAGSYIFMDTTYGQVLADFDSSLTVLAMVTSRPAPERVVLDCGAKTLAGDFGTPAIQGLPPAASCRLSEEHSIWKYDGEAPRLQVGDKVRVIPAHCCSTVNLHDVYHVIQGEKLVDLWPIPGARKTQ